MRHWMRLMSTGLIMTMTAKRLVSMLIVRNWPETRRYWQTLALWHMPSHEESTYRSSTANGQRPKWRCLSFSPQAVGSRDPVGHGQHVLAHDTTRSVTHVDPGNDIDRASEDEHVEEEERNRCRAGRRTAVTQQGGNHHHANRQCDTTTDHGPATTDLVQSEGWNEIADWKHKLNEAGDEKGSAGCNADAACEDLL